MKKILTTAMVLGALYGTANAAPITSPIYMPEAGKILSELSIGYTSQETDVEVITNIDELYSAVNINLNGKVGISDKLSLNYGFNYDFSRKVVDEDMSAKFTNYFVGVTGRVLDAGVNKLDIIFNVGQQDDQYLRFVTTPYAELAVRYGLELDMYNLAFSLKGKYVNDYENFGNTDTEKVNKIDGGFNFGFALENEFIFTDNFTVGLDLYYNLNDDYALFDSYSVYGFNLDANFGLNENNFIGAYFTMDISDAEVLENNLKIEPTTYKFGVKLTSKF